MTTDLAASPTPSPSARRAGEGPDFICIGMMKAGTQWLYDQLQHHPEFWMTPYKELHYFDREFPNRKLREAADLMASSPVEFVRAREEEGHRPLDPRDAPFFRKIATFEGPERDFDFYASLFEPAGGQLTGDITPAYSKLPRGVVKAIAQRFDRVKVIMMLRDPVERLWSQWSMSNLKRIRLQNLEGPDGRESDLGALRDWAERNVVDSRSFPTEIALRWRNRFGDRFSHFFLDDVAARPSETRVEILKRLGATRLEPYEVPTGFNRKEERLRFERTPEIRAYMKSLFKDERRRCAELFGGAARNWPDAPY